MCEFTMEAADFMSIETGTLTLVKYFPRIYQVIAHCFSQAITFRAGIVNVGIEQNFVVILSGLVRGNETGVWEEANGTNTAKRITIA